MTSNIPEAVRRLSPISEATRGFAPVPEAVWEKARRNQIFRERNRLVNLGRIRFDSPPVVMVKNEEGHWRLPSYG
jgi:hypothetical protein